MDLAVVTGGGTGLGREICLELDRRGFASLIVGRRQQPLEATQALASSGGVEALVADVATVRGRAAVVEAVGRRQLRFLIHNAAVLEPVGPLAAVELEAWRYAMSVNLEAPLFLSQALLPKLSGGRILHVSTGAAHRPLAGWGSYCVSKAGLYMAYQVLREELAGSDVCVGSLRPGVIDTDMQRQIRQLDPAQFPAVRRFRQLKLNDELRSPREVASFIGWLLCETDAHEFSAAEWEMGNSEQAARWRQDWDAASDQAQGRS